MKIKHELFCQALIEHNGNATKAYQQVYGCKGESAAVSGCRLLRNVKVRQHLCELLHPDDSAISELVESLKDGVKATKPLKAGKRIIYVPDHRTRLKTKILVLKMYGIINK
jgi:phage terminase small subunit